MTEDAIFRWHQLKYCAEGGDNFGYDPVQRKEVGSALRNLLKNPPDTPLPVGVAPGFVCQQCIRNRRGIRFDPNKVSSEYQGETCDPFTNQGIFDTDSEAKQWFFEQTDKNATELTVADFKHLLHLSQKR